MKFIVSSEILLKKLQLVGGVLNSSNTLPILDNFLFEIKKGMLSITASDLETTMITQITVEAKEDGLIAIPAKLLLDTLKTFPDQPLTFTIDKESFGIEISSDYGKYKLIGHNGQEFPKTPKLESPSSINVDGAILSNAVNKTLFATGNDELRPVMSGVYFELNSDDITFVATDAHKLVKYQFGGIESDQTATMILPKKGLTLLKNSISGGDDVKISFNQKNIFFEFENTMIICRLIDAKYPDYNSVIPLENPQILKVNRTDLINSLRRINIYANKTTNQAVFNLSEKSLTISTQDLDFSNEATEQVACEYMGEPMSIGFNVKFLAEMLSVMGTKEIEIQMSTPNRPGILVPSDQKENEDLLMLVMPLMASY